MYNNFSQQNRIVYHHMFLIILMSCMWRRWPVETTLIIVIVLILSFPVILLFFFYSPRNYKYNVHSSRRYQPERNLYSALWMWHMKPTLQLKVIYLRIDMDFLHFFLISTLLIQNPDSIVLISSILNSLCFRFSIKWNKILNENFGSF